MKCKPMKHFESYPGKDFQTKVSHILNRKESLESILQSILPDAVVSNIEFEKLAKHCSVWK